MKRKSNFGIKPIEFKIEDCKGIPVGTASKGNQDKWWCETTFVKADAFGYEGLAETLASEFAHYTNIEKFAPIVDYNVCRITRTNVLTGEVTRGFGCNSTTLFETGDEFITICDIITACMTNKELKEYERQSCVGKIQQIVELVRKHTGITNFGEWLTCLLEFDWVLLNEDRHFNNIGVMRKADGAYKLMPLFDTGAALLSDVSIDYSLDSNWRRHIDAVKAKPFSTSFKKQVEAAEVLYGKQLHYTVIAEKLNDKLFVNIQDYPERYRQRAFTTFKHRIAEFDAIYGVNAAY